MKTGELFGRILAALLVTCLLAAGALAETDKIDLRRFRVTVTWVNGPTRAPQDISYEYDFVNADTEESYPLVVELPAQAGDDARILRATGEILVPAENADGSKAVYLLSAKDSAYFLAEGISYAVSASESEDPAHGTTYSHRRRTLSQQIVPAVAVEFDGVEPVPFELTLSMTSWAKDDEFASHSATATVETVPEEGVNLLTLFGDAENAPRFRHFVMSELAWDGEAIAGTNEFSVEVTNPEGLIGEITGSADTGFTIVFKPAT